MKVEVAYPKKQHDSTLDAPKLLNDIQNSHPISQSCLLKGKKIQNASGIKANKTTIIPSKISSVYECNTTIALLPRFELAQIY